MKATIFHCGEEWEAYGALHSGFFIPNIADDLKCRQCGQISNNYMAVNVPINESREHNED